MRTYLDPSVLVALLTDDASTMRTDTVFRRHAPLPVVSGFAAAEFASALARRVRTGEIAVDAAQSAFSNLDRWVERIAERIEIGSPDVVAAAGFLRRLDLTLRTPDALNIALFRRANAVLATFDAKMATIARALGLEVAEG